MILAQRKSNDVLYEPSWPLEGNVDAWGRIWMSITTTGGFYFRELQEVKRRWWQLPCKHFVRTGKIWEPRESEFDVVDMWVSISGKKVDK
jgi:hypothetical protein